MIHYILSITPKLFLKGYLIFLKHFAPLCYARKIGVRFGKNCKFIHPNFGSEPFLITMGDHVEITNNVAFITHYGGVWIFRDKDPDIDAFAPITVGSNVFIGVSAVIMPGVTIGDNCIIGAGSIVTKDIPSNSIAVGVPAKVIKSVDEYYGSIKDKILRLKALPISEKRKILYERFNLK